MSEDQYEKTKDTILSHIQALFEELEQDMAMSHQEKYTLLEDAFESASDEDELKVAFERWYVDHAEDLRLDYAAGELWEQALGGEIDYDEYVVEKDDLENFEDEDEEVVEDLI
ncbi:hypothetical protein KJ785_00850 [Patescibacteria group bacterium]|nr:hypothetical protein [Patescibacteria group bacterium]